jgi:predicted outer membrane repeat protein
LLRDNSATSGDGGAVLCVDGCELWVTDSTLAANTAAAGAGGAILHASGGLFHLERSTLSGNSAENGGAIEATSKFRAVNTTLSGNMAASSGAFDAVRAVLESTTVFDNQATMDNGTGGFLLLEPSIIVNSIVAGNRNGGGPDNCNSNSSGIVSMGFNLSDTDSADCNFTHATDLVDTEPLLDELADNDAIVQTHALTAESPAVDAGDDERCPAMDQRGLARPADGDDDGTATCDIGAFELQPEPEPEPPSEPPPPSGGSDNGGGGGGAVSWPVLLGLLALCRRRRFSLVLAALLLGVNGCGGGGGDSANPPPPPPPSSTWDDMNWEEGQWG